MCSGLPHVIAASIEKEKRGNDETKAFYVQLDRLDPANRSVAVHNVVDINLDRRTKKLGNILQEMSACPPYVHIEHFHKGKFNERTPTKGSLIEFRSRTDRDIALKLLEAKEVEDETHAKLVFKRARTALQKQRNDMLIKAETTLKQHAPGGSDMKIAWKERRIEVNSDPAFVQNRDSPSRSFLAPFTNVQM